MCVNVPASCLLTKQPQHECRHCVNEEALITVMAGSPEIKPFAILHVAIRAG